MQMKLNNYPLQAEHCQPIQSDTVTCIHALVCRDSDCVNLIAIMKNEIPKHQQLRGFSLYIGILDYLLTRNQSKSAFRDLPASS